MKKLILGIALLLVVVFSISSCIKNETTPPTTTCTPLTVTAPSGEVANLKAYLDSVGIVATQDYRGFFYSFDTTGSTDTLHPTACSNVGVTYRGTFLNGTVFDSTGTNNPIAINISGTIAGWQEAIPLMKNNAVMNLYLPPSLAYGSADYQSIPANSYLIFKIKLWGFY
jgi:FKBP-type peptidyl-prolyl cis-trans isomerase FkpA